jgi:hypothetical protein
MKMLLVATFSLAAWAQTTDFNLDAVAARAKDKAEVTLEGPLLQQALQMAPPTLKDKLGTVKKVVIRHYEFAELGQYADSDLDNIRSVTSRGPDWARIINVNEEKQRVEIYTQSQDAKITGLLLMVAQPKEVTVVQVEGSIDVASLQELVKSTIHYDLKSAGGQ